MELNFTKAFRILRRNYGCPGPDNISIQEIRHNFFYHLECLNSQIESGSYVFSPPRQTVILTGKNSVEARTIYVYSVIDRWLQIALKLELEKCLDFKNTVFSYRKGRNKIHALMYILNLEPKFLLTLDIKKFFYSIDINRLLKKLKSKVADLSLFYLIENSVTHSQHGLPLGNCISPILANFYLSEIDETFNSNFSRYSDDLFFSLERFSDANDIICMVKRIIEERLSLQLNLDKMFVYINPRIENVINEFPWILNTQRVPISLTV